MDDYHWIPANEALALVRTRSGGDIFAIRSIATHAHSGLVTARAALFVRTLRDEALPGCGGDKTGHRNAGAVLSEAE